ncbi:MAG: hypothetical protein WA948_10855 [Pontixanthobacter sp.]
MKLRTMTTAVFALALPATGLARDDVELTRSVYVERQAANGNGTREVATVSRFRPGDTVILVVNWKSDPERRGFAVSSPIPRTLSYRGSSRSDQIVSVDDGRSWGPLQRLTVADASGARMATPEDVTHLRWKIPAVRARAGRGQLTYSAIVKRLPR